MSQPVSDNNVNIGGFLEVEQFISLGSIKLATTLSQTGTTIIGTNGDFTLAMQGGVIQFSDKTTAYVVAFINTFTLTASVSQTKPQQAATIIFGGFQAAGTGSSAPNLNTTNLVTISLSSTNITAFNNVMAGNDVIATNAVNSGSLNVTNNATVGGNITITGVVMVVNITATGNISANGTITGGTVNSNNNINAVATITGLTVNATGNVNAGGTVTGAAVTSTGVLSGDNANITNNLTVGGNATATNVIATTNIQSVTLQTTGLLTAQQVSAGGGGIQSNATISTTNGNITTTNGNITSSNGTVQGNTVQSAGAMISTGPMTAQTSMTVNGAFTVNGTLSFPSIAGTKGEILVSNGTNVVSQTVGTDGSPVIYNSSTSTGLSSSTPTIGPIGGAAVGGFTGGSVSYTGYRVGQLGGAIFTGTNTLTNTSGGGTTYVFQFVPPVNPWG